MITAVDTNVLVDVFGGDQEHSDASAEQLRRCIQDGVVVACDLVWAETTAAFGDAVAAERAMGELGVGYSPVDRGAALKAGLAWKAYRASGGTRARMVADFLIAAHAEGQCDRLLTRDRGFYKRYFKGLDVLDPSQPHGRKAAGRTKR